MTITNTGTDHGRYVLIIYDATTFDPRVISSPSKTRTLMAGGFYVAHAMQPNSVSIRQGVVFLCFGVSRF